MIETECDSRLAAWTESNKPGSLAENSFLSKYPFFQKWQENQKASEKSEIGLITKFNYPFASPALVKKYRKMENITDDLPKLYYENFTGWERVIAFFFPYKNEYLQYVPAGIEALSKNCIPNDHVFAGKVFKNKII